MRLDRLLVDGAAALLIPCTLAVARAVKAWHGGRYWARRAGRRGAGTARDPRDRPGNLQAAGGIGAAFLLIERLEQTFRERRHDGSDRRSFPPEHSDTAFAAAATLQNRHGRQVACPRSSLRRSWVSRIEARQHHRSDVLAGAAIGGASGVRPTLRHDGDGRVLPWSDTPGAGLTLEMRL